MPIKKKAVFLQRQFEKHKHNKNLETMEKYIVAEWPECQEFMELEGFEENSTLIEINENMGIGSQTYLINKEWAESFNNL